MKYPLFLTDFDGTLVRADGTVSQKNIETIAEYRKRGGIFTVVTGRMLSSILPRLKELGIFEGLVAAYQGAAIADVKTGKLLRNDGFLRNDALEIVRALEAEDRHIHVYMGDVLYCNRNDELLHAYEKTCGVKGVIPRQPLSTFLQGEHGVISKILCMVEPEQQESLVESLKERFGKRYFITSSAEWLVEAMPFGTDKASAVRFLSEYFKIPVEKTAAIGDQYNDIPMIEAAGGKFAVANAVPPLKGIAKVVSSVEEDGVTEALAEAMEDSI